MKRNSPLRRLAYLRRRERLKKVNAKRQAKRRKRYERYMQSPEWKERRAACFARAGRRCEYEEDGVRCAVTTKLQCHHKTYRRFMRERPEDLMCLCKTHHDLIESRLRPWNRNRWRKAG